MLVSFASFFSTRTTCLGPLPCSGQVQASKRELFSTGVATNFLLKLVLTVVLEKKTETEAP
jgi:hypothetical protein